jgi:Flp pilus assembly protein TadD
VFGASCRSDLAERCYASAYQALARGDTETAEHLFGLMAILLPQDERPWLGLAAARERKADWRAAAGLYHVGCALVPHSARCWLGRVRALEQLERFDEAERIRVKAEELTEGHARLAAVAGARTTP